MIQVLTQPMLRVHIGFGYMLLEPTDENLRLARQLIDTPLFTTTYDQDLQRSIHVRQNDRKIADSAEITQISYTNTTEAEYLAATVEPVEPAAEAAE